MRASFDARIARAAQLSEKYPAARELLDFYRELAIFQKQVLSDRQPDVRGLTAYFPDLLSLVNRAGPEGLAQFGKDRLSSSASQERILVGCWEGEPGDAVEKFYARVLLQPYAENLASRGQVYAQATSATCPFCSAKPVAAVLRGEGDGAKRWLLCSICSTEWQFRRVLCPSCGEEDKEKLPVYTATEFNYVRAEACDSCKTYIKAIDLTREGHAVAVVDEIATVALTIRTEEIGYTKLESNLLGL